MKILVTGCAGFIGYHLCLKLLENPKNHVFGIDNLNKYYDLKLKKDRLSNLKKLSKKFRFYKKDISNISDLKKIFKNNNFNIVVHLAAQAGVRYSIQNPRSYFETNMLGFFNVIELSKVHKIKHFIFASTSSVYGSNNNFPLKESENTDTPLSFYAATKKSNEIMAYAYSNIYNLPCTGLRFFTVYGPYGRPDMFLYLLTSAIKRSKRLNLFNKGNHYRDFTYIDDVVGAIIGIIPKLPSSKVPFSVYNIGSSSPKNIKNILKMIERIFNKRVRINLKNIQKGDVFKTHADISKISKRINFKPKISAKEGINRFVKWYNQYYKK